MAVTALSILSSCSTERILARQFLKNTEPEAMLLLAPDYVFKKGYKLPDSLDSEKYSPYQLDSVLLANSTIIRNVNDSVYFSAFMFGFSNALKQFGYLVYESENAGEFLSKGAKSLIVNLAQSELEEYYDSIGEKAQFGDEDIYSYEFFITSVNLNFWFEINGVNYYDSIMPVLFSQQVLSDRVEGGFRYFPFSGDVKYIYAIDSIELRDLYNAAFNAGELNATYLHDYLLNRYIQKKMPEGKLPQKEFTYNRFTGSLKSLKTRGFVEIQ
ncbi:MAG: hypothetical protein K0B15_03470 [Lentimicrobium sp.]|nr:hypothetical protein [Lentimicrobium sp.]